MFCPWLCLNNLGPSLKILIHLMVCFTPFKWYIQFLLPFAQEWISPSSNPDPFIARHMYHWSDRPDFVHFAHVISVTLLTFSNSRFTLTSYWCNSKWFISLPSKGLSKFYPYMYDFSRQGLYPGVTRQTEQNLDGDRGMQWHVKVFFCEILLSHQDTFHILPALGRIAVTENYFFFFYFL